MRYNEAWNAHDLDRIMALHSPDMVFENHTAGERAEGEAVRGHIGQIFESWPDIAFPKAGSTCERAWWSRSGRRPRPTPTDAPRRPRRRADRQDDQWDGLDVIPFESGLVKRKDVYSDSVSILRQLELLD